MTDSGGGRGTTKKKSGEIQAFHSMVFVSFNFVPIYPIHTYSEIIFKNTRERIMSVSKNIQPGKQCFTFDYMPYKKSR